jgi:hypothetical protein
MGAFEDANSPGRNSAVGDFVPGKNGGWVPKNHPDAAGGPTRVDGGPDPGLPEGTVGADPSAGGPAGPAMAGLRSAASGNSGSATGVRELAPQGAGNPMLGQRIYPTAMKQLSQLPRVY